jgi:hypothetical protein
MTLYHNNSNLYGIMNTLEKGGVKSGHRCQPPVHQHPTCLITIYTEAFVRSVRGSNLDQITGFCYLRFDSLLEIPMARLLRFCAWKYVYFSSRIT